MKKFLALALPVLFLALLLCGCWGLEDSVSSDDPPVTDEQPVTSEPVNTDDPVNSGDPVDTDEPIDSDEPVESFEPDGPEGKFFADEINYSTDEYGAYAGKQNEELGWYYSIVLYRTQGQKDNSDERLPGNIAGPNNCKLRYLYSKNLETGEIRLILDEEVYFAEPRNGSDVQPYISYGDDIFVVVGKNRVKMVSLSGSYAPVSVLTYGDDETEILEIAHCLFDDPSKYAGYSWANDYLYLLDGEGQIVRFHLETGEETTLVSDPRIGFFHIVNEEICYLFVQVGNERLEYLYNWQTGEYRQVYEIEWEEIWTLPPDEVTV